MQRNHLTFINNAILFSTFDINSGGGTPLRWIGPTLWTVISGLCPGVTHWYPDGTCQSYSYGGAHPMVSQPIHRPTLQLIGPHRQLNRSEPTHDRMILNDRHGVVLWQFLIQVIQWLMVVYMISQQLRAQSSEQSYTTWKVRACSHHSSPMHHLSHNHVIMHSPMI